jgi:Raf kinase inhibitor-like YbhB/YbcL family protein
MDREAELTCAPFIVQTHRVYADPRAQFSQRNPVGWTSYEGRTVQLKSSAFSDGSVIPRRCTCEGEDLSPPLQWSDAPAETRSFVLLCDDLDAPVGKWHHWAAFDIPVERTALADGAGRPGQAGLTQAINDFGKLGYGGPCPPRSHGPHHYHFRVLALSTERLSVRKNPTCAHVEREARKHLLEEAIIIGLYER